MIRASISLRTRVISNNFRSKAANIFFTKAGSVIFTLSAILACGSGRASGPILRQTTSLPHAISLGIPTRNNGHYDCERLP